MSEGDSALIAGEPMVECAAVDDSEVLVWTWDADRAEPW
jgi:hypothetical protein